MRFLTRESQLEVIEGATHKFNDHLNEIVNLAINWYNNSFSLNGGVGSDNKIIGELK
jgi:hypothetical protein